MKKIMRSFMAMALSLSLVLSGCSKDDDDNKLSAFTGTYPVEITVNLLPDKIPTNLVLTESGGNFKASANLADYGKIEIELSSVTDLPASFVKSAEEEADAGTVSGYLFKVNQQNIELNLGSLPVTSIAIEGAEIDFENGGVNGYHGLVIKGKENGQEHKAIGIMLKGTGLMSQLGILIFTPEEE
jgi:hypothetical protein